MSRWRALSPYTYRSLLSLLVLVSATVIARAHRPWGQMLTSLLQDVQTAGRNPHERAEFIEDYYGEVLRDRTDSDFPTPPAGDPTAPEKTEPGDHVPTSDPPAAPVPEAGPPVVASDTKIVPPAEYDEWGTLHEAGLTRPTSGFLEHELRPDTDLPHKGVRVRVNRWGMRDAECSQEKPPGVFRIAIVGASNTMGSGVPVEQIYPELLENRLNQDLDVYRRYEVLNFSVSGYHLYDRLYVVENKILDFDPDLILVSVLPTDVNVLYRRFARRIQTNPNLHFDFLTRIATDARTDPLLRIERLRRILKPYKEELVVECLAELNRIAIDTGVPVAAVVLWLETSSEVDDRLHWLVDQARSQGLIVLRVVDTFSKGDLDLYFRPEESDFHPSIEGHRLLADELLERMSRQKDVRRLLKGGRRRPHLRLPNARLEATPDDNASPDTSEPATDQP